MSSEWTTVALGDVTKFKYGKFLAKSSLNSSGFPVFSGYGIVGYLPTYQFDEPQIVIVCRGEGGTGDVKMSPPRCSITNLSIVLTPDQAKVEKEFLYWALRGGDTHRLRTGSAQAQIVVGSLEKFPLKVPTDLGYQRQVARVLGAIEDRITLLRETNTTLESIAQALFKSWFVDFDPVRAKMEGRAPEGMDEATAALFPDGFEESTLGYVPLGWQVKPIGDTVETVGGATPDTKVEAYWRPPAHHWTSPKDLSGASAPVLLSTERKVSDLGLAKIGSGLLPVGSLLMSSRAPIGYLSLAQVPVAINQGYIGMLPGGELPPLYLLFWCRRNMDAIKGRANGSTFMEISKKAFRPIPAVVPTSDVMNAFVEVAQRLFDRLVENEQQAETLSTLRDTLLPRLIAGQLRLPLVKEIIAEATYAD
jgi:type I restriction enzyme, S subunit